jgi:hypothetical protein
MLLPNGALLLAVVAIGLATILGLLRGGAAFSLLGVVLLFALLGPFVEGIVEGVAGTLPPWMSLVLLIVIGLVLLRGLAALLIGRRASDHMVGILAADLVRVAFLALLFPFRLVWRTVRAMTNGGV